VRSLLKLCLSPLSLWRSPLALPRSFGRVPSSRCLGAVREGCRRVRDALGSRCTHAFQDALTPFKIMDEKHKPLGPRLKSETLTLTCPIAQMLARLSRLDMSSLWED
jgi:hypothetical protein